MLLRNFYGGIGMYGEPVTIAKDVNHNLQQAMRHLELDRKAGTAILAGYLFCRPVFLDKILAYGFQHSVPPHMGLQR